MSKPAIVTEYRFDGEKEAAIFRAVPSDSGGYEVTFDGAYAIMSTADLACAADFFARIAAESSKETA